MSFALCDLLGFLGNAGQMPLLSSSPLPTSGLCLPAALPSGSVLYASKYYLLHSSLAHTGPFFLSFFLFLKYIKLTPSSGLCTCFSLRPALG